MIGEPIIELHGITVGFGPVMVLQRVSTSFARDETYAVVGPSGSGKSTLLAVIAGQLTPQAGSVKWPGGLPNKSGDPVSRGATAWIGQLPMMLPGRTAAENVRAACELAGIQPSDAIVRARVALEQVGLEHRAGVLASRLSGGEQQRVAVARALASDCQLVLADEPTASLDRSTAATVGRAIVSARRPGTTVIVATHDLELARSCRRRLSIERGRLVEIV